MTKRAYDAEHTKKKLLEGAMVLFAKKGYAATSIDDICEASGCSKGSMYYHFRSKEQLFLELAEQAFSDSWRRWNELSAPLSTATDKLYAYADYFVDNHNRPLNKAGEEFIAKIGAASEAGQRFFGIVMGVIADFESLVSEGIASGEFKNEDPKELAFIILSYFSGLSDSYLFMDRDGMKRLFRKAAGFLLEGIRI
ncbi:TetR/AcrR family transcriptional regulator [Cohnella faecalis]|uniref:TetR/AcrR family transcriptional regulator n=1 Tax=Cohnella faecalis TaxID=2315694 RepID=A0A398CFB0_9BACL|nr:TetR/AcrR family transcriptional regulator [Cohnella faecalis]RIE01095.1 TetR/AcrR family transcriptional regulator [Cohnella faecalis]